MSGALVFGSRIFLYNTLQYNLCSKHRTSSEIWWPTQQTSSEHLCPHFTLAPRFFAIVANTSLYTLTRSELVLPFIYTRYWNQQSNPLCGDPRKCNSDKFCSHLQLVTSYNTSLHFDRFPHYYNF